MPYLNNDDLRFLVGIEDTCVLPPAGSAMARLDEHALTGHDRNWREDMAAAARFGASGLRYGVSWPRVCPAPGVHDWSELDERLEFAVRELGLTVIADLVHYGTPTWLSGAFADPRYPGAVADFASAFAARYRGLVDHLTPLNEPLTTASFCGLRGVWPPALTGWDGWVTVTLSIVEGIRRTVDAVRAVNPDAVIVHVEAAALYETRDDMLAERTGLLAGIGHLPTELLLGRVTADHPLRTWLISHGAPDAILDGLLARPTNLDVLGVNYYPDLTPRVIERVDGSIRQVTANRWTGGLELALRTAGERFGLPMMVTETSIEGDETVRRSWAEESIATVRRLRAEGLDIRGYTWWPLLDFVDWSYASGGRNVEEFVLDPSIAASPAAEMYGDVTDGVTPFLRRMGLITLTEAADGSLLRSDTEAAAAYAKEAGE
ncbi:family 1 glycosylhydrolase [Paractinoplanes globisporus]|uniref:Family 1 glycosylhydrolase n=1 Tax=Paractinoplanes globisporus TaxID=113565 RepID=A0ABW6W906_9ACTN|nr:family 1 glycosylhydrolase [Actinoplanes globisporus]